MNNRDFISVERARASVFRVYTALLCQPEEDLVRNDGIFDTLRLALNSINPEYFEVVARMREAAVRYTVEQLLIEYARLCVGPFGMLVPPYSSLYFGSDTLMSPETVWVLDFYRRVGLKFDQEVGDAPDHIAVETEFMYWLIHNELASLESDDGARSFTLWQNQHEFFEKHYRRWVPEFCTRVTAVTDNEYFRLLAQCLNKFITQVEIPSFPHWVSATRPL